MQFIDNQKEFDNFCGELSSESIIFIDTEFNRQTTYYPILCLIQIATSKHRVIIDALSGIDLMPLKSIFLNKDTIKVLHSAEQDLEIFFYLFKSAMQNVFDTQIAAQVTGMNEKLGYASLCMQLLNVKLDKHCQKANWLTRPLTQELTQYAILDVEFLPALYRILHTTIQQRNLWDNYNYKISKFLTDEHYTVRYPSTIKRLNLTHHSAKFKRNIMKFLELREECAQTLNIPRNFCLSDKSLVKICTKLPTTHRELQNASYQGKMISNAKFTEKLLNLCAAIQN